MLVKMLKGLEVCKTSNKQLFNSQNKQDNKRLYQSVEISIMIKILFHSSMIQSKTRSQTDHILANEKMKMKIQSYWYKESDHCLIETKLEIKKKQKRIDSEIIYIENTKQLWNLKNIEFT
ncbi:unnamed protein product (macronuclear) [Paramecium tetraurelia]|uniref:Uncharacterized protein n=1 Tax=Paramecium tetraurelia TaxID=5888 RepID=A0BT94_PARTE|nr:uncharacterized protein GSPATT00031993001 [Paramecium tetraurelia]CAK61761.1 unnamed protein product [Paramecium tetraurelia]|eukprot:XP_001429159.1 hypothetical protein (macronuclear) [Paramecium tetraurelia strain d4-2]